MGSRHVTTGQMARHTLLTYYIYAYSFRTQVYGPDVGEIDGKCVWDQGKDTWKEHDLSMVEKVRCRLTG